MTKREPWVVPVLTIVTCGFYHIYWQYVTTDELKRVSGRDDLNPLLDLILGMVTCGIWTVYVMYRNANVVHECFQRASVQHESKASLILILYVVAVFNGLTALLAPAILQEEFNKLTDLAPAGGPFR
jgi:hypothetical protein